MRELQLTALRCSIERGVAFVTIDNPPRNLFDSKLIESLEILVPELETTSDVRVVVFRSAHPEFFVAHADVALLRDIAATEDAQATVERIHRLMQRIERLPMPTIAEVAGSARGAGSELLLSLDLRFAARGLAVMAQPELAFGIIPGAGGTQRLPRLLGRGRALEIIMGGSDFDADLAERYGYFNRALAADELAPFVENLAYRIASFPAPAVAAAKRAVAAADGPVQEGFAYESAQFVYALGTPQAKARMHAFLALGGQTHTRARGEEASHHDV